MRRRGCYARFGCCERRLAKYTRCVSVAARGVASSLPAPFQLSGASFEVNVIRPLSLSFPYARPRSSHYLLFAVSFMSSLPLSVSLPLSYRLVFFICSSFSRSGHSDASRMSELSSKYIAPKLVSTRSSRTLALESSRDNVGGP